MTKEQAVATNLVLQLAKSRVKYLEEKCVYEVPPAMARGMLVVEGMLADHHNVVVVANRPRTTRPTRRLELR